MPVCSLFLFVWVWCSQLAALQSKRLLLLGEPQYSKLPATVSVWINFSVPLSWCCKFWTYQWGSMTSCGSPSREVQEELETYGGQRHNKGRALEWLQRKFTARKTRCSWLFFIGYQETLFTSHWLKAGFQGLQENKEIAWLASRATKKALCKKTPFLIPLSLPLAVNDTFLFAGLSQSSQLKTVIFLILGNIPRLFISSRQAVHCKHFFGIFHNTQTLACWNPPVWLSSVQFPVKQSVGFLFVLPSISHRWKCRCLLQ